MNRSKDKVQEIIDQLKANEFWCNTDDEKILACRFPIASYSEVGEMNFVENELYSKYCSKDVYKRQVIGKAKSPTFRTKYNITLYILPILYLLLANRQTKVFIC